VKYWEHEYSKTHPNPVKTWLLSNNDKSVLLVFCGMFCAGSYPSFISGVCTIEVIDPDISSSWRMDAVSGGRMGCDILHTRIRLRWYVYFVFLVVDFAILGFDNDLSW